MALVAEFHRNVCGGRVRCERVATGAFDVTNNVIRVEASFHISYSFQNDPLPTGQGEPTIVLAVFEHQIRPAFGVEADQRS
jgi:hypothetical protein